MSDATALQTVAGRIGHRRGTLFEAFLATLLLLLLLFSYALSWVQALMVSRSGRWLRHPRRRGAG